MRSEIFHIRDHEIGCEIYESELKLGRQDRNPIKVLTLSLGRFSSDDLMKLGGNLWVEVARRYLTLKKEFAEKSSGEVIGRISFECDHVRVEFEFSKLTRSAVLSLGQIAPFLKQYPQSEEMRISRDGPILVRFQNPDPEPSVAESGKAGSFKLHYLFGRLRKEWGAIWRRG